MQEEYSVHEEVPSIRFNDPVEEEEWIVEICDGVVFWNRKEPGWFASVISKEVPERIRDLVIKYLLEHIGKKG